jgi:hypothetical protein
MSVENPLTLGEYIHALVAALAQDDPQGLDRMREVVGSRAARIELDEEAVEVVFLNGELRVQPLLGFSVDGTGSTDSATVLDLLDGNLEVSAGILDGRLSLTGDPENIARICLAIETLLNASARSPELQKLAAHFRHQHHAPSRRSEEIAWYRFALSPNELSLLKRLDLLPE